MIELQTSSHDSLSSEAVRRMGLFSLVAWLSLVLATIGLAALAIFGSMFPHPSLRLAVGSFLLGDVAAILLGRAQLHQWAIRVYLVAVTIPLCIVAHLTNGVTGPFAVSLAAIPVLSGLLAGRRAALWGGLGVSALYFSLFVLEHSRLLPAQHLSVYAVPWVSLVAALITILGTTVAVSVSTAQWKSALAGARERGQTLARTAQAATESASSERAARLWHERSVRQLRQAVQRYLACMRQLSEGDYEVRLSPGELDADGAVSEDLSQLAKCLNSIAEAMAEMRTTIRTLQRRRTRESWAGFVTAGYVEPGFRYIDGEVSASEENWLPVMGRAMNDGDMVIADRELALPIRVGGEMIGVLGALRPAGAASASVRWTENETTVIRAAAEQLSQTVEMLHLLDEIRRNALRERIVAETTSRILEPLQIDDVIKVAADEIRQALDLEELVVQLRLNGSLDAGDGSAPDAEHSSAQVSSEDG